MMNMEWSILPGYAREEEIRQLFTEYTNMVLAGDPAFAGYLARQHYEEELAHPARKYAPPHGRLYLVCTGSTPVGCAALKALGVPFLVDSTTNQLFPILPDAVLTELAKTYVFSEQERVDDTRRAVRFCTSWATKPENVERLCADLTRLLS